MQFTKVMTGIAILIGIVGLGIPMFSDFVRYCFIDPIEPQTQFNQSQPMSCRNVMSTFPYFLAFFLPVVGVGVWILVFGIQHRSLVTFKRNGFPKPRS